jgi:membrane associated rhomboid family serine protease
MNLSLKRVGSAISPGVRGLILLLLATYVAALAGRFTGAYDLEGWLVLVPRGVLSGQVWRLITYSLLPRAIFDFVLNGFALAVLGSLIERAWTRGQLWGYFLIVAAGTGLVRFALVPSAELSFVGATGAVYGFLAAWARLFGQQPMSLMGVWTTTARNIALVMALLGLLTMLSFADWRDCAAVAAGGVTGWFYLSIRWRRNLAAPASQSSSERISRLEF